MATQRPRRITHRPHWVTDVAVRSVDPALYSPASSPRKSSPPPLHAVPVSVPYPRGRGYDGGEYNRITKCLSQSPKPFAQTAERVSYGETPPLGISSFRPSLQRTARTNGRSPAMLLATDHREMNRREACCGARCMVSADTAGGGSWSRTVRSDFACGTLVPLVPSPSSQRKFSRSPPPGHGLPAPLLLSQSANPTNQHWGLLSALVRETSHLRAGTGPRCS